MAEFVQYRSEQTISELEQMQRIELFSKEEIRLIAAKRKRYEYKMQRLIRNKDTYLRFIQYELDLIKLIKLRRERLKILDKEDEIEALILNRINNLFYQAVGKFKSDVKLWMTHINFCIQWNMKSSVSQLLTRLLAVHSDKVKLWKFAANWEAEQNDSVDTARNLMLRGLRFHPKSKALYKAYLTMEFKQAEIVSIQENAKERLEADLLSAEIEILTKKLENAKEETQESILSSLNEKQEALASKVKKLSPNMTLIEIIIDSALNRFRDPQTFAELYEVIKQFEGSLALQLQFLEKLEEKFPNNEVVLNLKAQRNLTPVYSAATCKLEYASALKSLPTEKMWSYYLEALLSACKGSKYEKYLKKDLITCHNLKLLSEKFYPQLMSLLTEEDKKKMSIVLQGLDRFPKYGPLHQMHVAIYLSRNDEAGAFKAFERAEADLGKDNLEMLILYKTIIQHYEVVNIAVADKLFKRSLFAGPNVSSELKPRYLQWVFDNKGIEEARAEYHKLKLAPPLSLALHYKMIDLEMESEKPNVHNVRLCYDIASHQFGEKDIDLWMKFISFETRKGDPNVVHLLFSRAKAQLSTDLLEEFVKQHTINRTNGKV